MKMRLAARFLLGGVLSMGEVLAQGADQNLVNEVNAVRNEINRSIDALGRYTWTENTEVSVKGDVKSSTAVTCRYDRSGKIVRTPIGGESDKNNANAVSKRLSVRKKAEMQDNIDRAVGRIQTYFPPSPEQIGYLLRDGLASLGQSKAGEWELRFTKYYEDGDSLIFTYDAASKVLLRINVKSTLGSPKDPVTMEALFEKLPDGVNHLSSTSLFAKSKKVQVTTRNVMYKKLAD